MKRRPSARRRRTTAALLRAASVPPSGEPPPMTRTHRRRIGRREGATASPAVDPPSPRCGRRSCQTPGHFVGRALGQARPHDCRWREGRAPRSGARTRPHEGEVPADLRLARGGARLDAPARDHERDLVEEQLHERIGTTSPTAGRLSPTKTPVPRRPARHRIDRLTRVRGIHDGPRAAVRRKGDRARPRVGGAPDLQRLGARSSYQARRPQLELVPSPRTVRRTRPASETV
jgi:hypothetical protein